MDKKPEDQNEEMPIVGLDDVLDFLDELFTSGKVVDVVYGFTDEGYEFCIDLETGDVEITYEDGSFENIPASDPRAKKFLDME